MTPNRRRFMKYLAKLFDLCVLAVSIVVALIVFSSPRGTTLAGFLAMRIKLENCLLFALFLAIWHNLFIACGLYVSKRLTTQRTQILEVCKATTLAVAILFLLARGFHLRIVSPRFVMIFWLSSTFMMAAGRVASRMLLWP